MISVLLVDDEPLLRLGFRLVLNTQPDLDVIGEAGDGAEAVRQVADLEPDVVLMDVRMPGTDGIEATEQIVRSHATTRVLILTTFDLDEYAFAALRAGAAGFLLKNAQPADLIAGIRTVASGDGVVAPRVTRRLIETFVGAGTPQSLAAQTENARLGRLTDREREVLVAMARGRSNAEIAHELGLSEATVKTHVSRILPKLGLRDRVQAVVLAYQTGLIRIV
ncbi:response regulator transcription factor [Actinomadura barringtoniae]|uniref:Response regulator transcription factor n=1 Tax=Actinomadura barringtoniae TaxID=1427535 RepID=A0A939T8K3_9ACTN|nr:response regulator transcription factor [Actinomadura barringtoniae]MBO2453234.1 response regulator transcription factor [Actinomadura barringtoniae]